MDFQETVPVTRAKSGGKTAAPNPFAAPDAVPAIALKTYPAGHAAAGKPIALSYVQTHENEAAVKTDRNRIRRQTSDAGAANTPPVTVYVDFQDANTETGTGKTKTTQYASKVTFWTVNRQKRSRKDKKTTGTPKPE